MFYSSLFLALDQFSDTSVFNIFNETMSLTVPHNIINLPKCYINVHGWVEYANFCSKEHSIPSIDVAKTPGRCPCMINTLIAHIISALLQANYKHTFPTYVLELPGDSTSIHIIRPHR
jgi:hypothetical protein